MTIIDYKLHRFDSGVEATLGVLHKLVGSLLSFRCFTLEDQHQKVKVPGETRIPAGRYEIKLRAAGGLHDKYKLRYPWHVGMLHLQSVPGFEWIYLHPGTTDFDTLGCILTGYAADSTGRMAIGKAQLAYEALYKEIAKHLQAGERAFIEVVDFG